MALGTQHGWVGLIGALTITYLLMYVTGVPLAEKNAATKPGWKEYAERTSRLVPLPPRN
jgi:steroid 5-alpha reductase family enzyme